MKMIQPENIPQFTGDLSQLDSEATALAMDASHIRGAGQGMHDRFQGLSAYYHAPEAEQLFATTLPVRDTADKAAGEVETVGLALEEYATEVRPIAAKLARLKRQAAQFVEDVGDDDDWAYDRDKVREHQDLLHDVNAAVGAFWEAERRTANKITALFGGPHYVANDGSHKPNMYGYKGSDLDHAKKTPWGSPVQQKFHSWDIGHWTKSFVWDGFIVDGVWGTLQGLGRLTGFNGWDEARAAWKDLGKVGVGAGIYLNSTLRDKPDSELPPFLRESKHAAKEAGKSLVAWDEWSKNPARAAGAVSFNVVTSVGTGGVGTAAKSGAIAKAIGTAGKIGRLADPMTYIFKGVGLAKVKVADVMAGLKNAYSGRYVDLADGSVKLPNHAVFHPDGSVKLPSGHYLDEYGTLYKADGTVVDRARVELSAADRQALSDTQRAQEPDLVHAHGPGGERGGLGNELGPRADHDPLSNSQRPSGPGRDLPAGEGDNASAPVGRDEPGGNTSHAESGHGEISAGGTAVHDLPGHADHGLPGPRDEGIPGSPGRGGHDAPTPHGEDIPGDPHADHGPNGADNWGTYKGEPVHYAEAPEDGLEPAVKAVRAYERIRATTEDVPKIAEKLKLDPDVVIKAKENLFLNRHEVQTGPYETRYNVFFTPDETIAKLWTKATNGTIKGIDEGALRGVIAHEYVEHRLMEAGMPFRSQSPGSWASNHQLDVSEIGAHDVAPLSFRGAPVTVEGTLKHWPRWGIKPPEVAIADDLSNLDEVVKAAKKGLGL
ncbi:protein phosphatase [Streptomyces sp. NPDC005355]|uniref:protein phosphatase n=1 Tax=Streptomyces sp. NPDC005355 TaxID=3157038 RepID=UPI0033BA6FF6